MPSSIPNVIADFSTVLALKVLAGATTATLVSATDSDGVALPTGVYGFTIDRKNSNKEYITCTLTGTALTDVKTIAVGTGVATTGFARAHRRSAEVVLTDFVAIKRIQDVLETGYPSATTPTTDYQLATKKYVDDTASGGAVTTDRVTVVGTCGENVVAGNLLYLKVSDSKWWKTDADLVATLDDVILGIAQGTGTANGLITGGVLIKGVDPNQSGLTANSLAYASNTAGGISSTSGTITRVVGVSKSTTSIDFDPEFNKTYKNYAADSVGSDSYAITLQSAFGAYYEGMEVTFKAGTANTGACTLNVNGLGAKTIKKNYNEDLATGDILANQLLTVQYDGTNFQIKPSPLASANQTILSNTNNSLAYTQGPLANSVVKSYFNMQFPFLLWTGATNGAATTDFPNWTRSGTDVYVPPMGAMADFGGTGADYIFLESPIFRTSANTPLEFDDTNIVIIDFMAKLPASSTGDIKMGFCTNNTEIVTAYNSSAANFIGFAQSAAGALYATIAKSGVGVTNTDISSGLTLTNWNNYRIELDLSNNALLYVNGVLKATLSGTNFPNGSDDVGFGFGRSNTALFQVTAPNFSLQLNP